MRLGAKIAAMTICLTGGFSLLWLLADGQCLKAIARETDGAVAEQPDNGAERFITVFPVNIKPGKQASLEMRTTMATVVGSFLERAGLKNVELAKSEFMPPESDEVEKIAAAFAQYVRENPPETQYALFAQFVGTPKSGARAIITVLVNRTGKVLLAERDTPEMISRLLRTWPRCPMECSLFVARRVQAFWDLADPVRPAAKGTSTTTAGKMETLLKKQSMIPPKAELEAMKKRLKEMKHDLAGRRVTVYPVHLADGSDPGCSEALVEAINSRGLFRAVVACAAPELKVEGSFNEQRILWSTARAFGQFIRKDPPPSGYALYADYGISSGSETKTDPGTRREADFVHLILCNREGELVLVDFQNSHHADFQKIRPRTCEQCNRLAIMRLDTRLHE